jgi:hypothetical protein
MVGIPVEVQKFVSEIHQWQTRHFSMKNSVQNKMGMKRRCEAAEFFFEGWFLISWSKILI